MAETAQLDVQIILSIKEGKGFEQVLQPTLLIGTLNGHSLETDKIAQSPNPQYATDLIWETDKIALRKMRTGQVPLKLECFAFKENGCKERIGYVLLSIRSAHVTSRYRDLSPKASWHRLLGLRNDIKAQKPELLVTLRVEDRRSTDLNPTVEIRNVVTDDVISQSDKIIPYLHSDEQLIQLGPLNTCCELFLLNITAMYIEHLHLLLPEHPNKDDSVHFSYRVLENDVELKPFKIQSEYDSVPHFLHEKVVVRIRSSLSVLKHYLQSEPHLLIFLKHENSIIAESSVDLQSLVPADNLQEFLESTASAIQERCFLTKQDSVEKPVDSQHSKPHLDLQLKLQYIGSQMNAVHDSDAAISPNNHITPSVQYNEENANNADERCPEIESHRNPSGDFGKFNANTSRGKRCAECRNVIKQSTDCSKHHADKVVCSRSCDAMFCNCISKNYTKNVGSYHCYCLHISLATITLLSAKLSGRQIEFRFHHPKAEITSTVRATMPGLSDEKVNLQNIGCQFHFISAPDEIKQLLQSFPPKISIYNRNEDAEVISLVLDLKPLFHQDKPECQYKLPLYDADRNKMGEMDVTLKLENCGPHFTLKNEAAGKNLGPPILDDSLAYKIVDELETWKERQKEMFKVELKKKEERHLSMLNKEWQKQKENLESKLACSVEQCKILANSLNNATEDLRTRRLKSLENETRLVKANEDLQWRYETKLQEMKDSMHAMQGDLTSKITKLKEKKTALEAQTEILIHENENLKLSMSKQAAELQIYQTESLAQDQTASLLQELKILEKKLENAQKGKSFFKEQWGKAVREIHGMKADHQQAMQVQIENSKEELQNADLAEILSADTKALTKDQILLNKIRKELEVINPSQTIERSIQSSRRAYNQIYAPLDNVCSELSSNGNNTSDESEEYNERLQALREERDSLLRTGSYAADDVVIRKLNTEIRSLLVSR